MSLGGTVSAEHGLGKRKAHLLALQYTPEQIESMREVKRRLDPQWLLNRGNLFAKSALGLYGCSVSVALPAAPL